MKIPAEDMEFQFSSFEGFYFRLPLIQYSDHNAYEELVCIRYIAGDYFLV